MQKERKPNQRADWAVIESEYVFGPGVSYESLAKRYGVSPRTVEYHGAPERGNWKEKRARYLREVEEIARKRLQNDAGDDQAESLKTFRERYTATTERMQTLLDRLIELFIPKPDATERERQECETRLHSLKPSIAAQLIVAGTERLSGIAKTNQLLGGQATERIENIPVPTDLSDLTEAEIERALRESFRSKGISR